MPFSAQAMLGSFHKSGAANNAPALPTLTSTGQTPLFRLYASAPTAHLYKDTALTLQATPGPSGSEDTVLGVRDISGASNNYVDTVSGHGSLLRTNLLNSKPAMIVDGSVTLIENDNSTNINLARTATHVAVFLVFEQVGTGIQPYIFMNSVKSRATPFDCLTIRDSTTSLQAGRWGGNSGANSPLEVLSTALNSGWTDYSNKIIKLVLRAAKGTGLVQKLDVSVSDGTTVAGTTRTYTNNGTDDVDSTSTPWDYSTIGGWYLSSVGYTGNAGLLAELAVWTGTSQMNDADVAALLTYGAGTAGF